MISYDFLRPLASYCYFHVLICCSRFGRIQPCPPPRPLKSKYPLSILLLLCWNGGNLKRLGRNRNTCCRKVKANRSGSALDRLNDAFRSFLFFCCRRYLLKSLYNDLQHLSAPRADTFPSMPYSGSEVELNVLPSPATSTSGRLSKQFSTSSVKAVKPSQTPQDQALRVQSSIARTAFALCFEEGCILFLLVMSQALGLFDFRCGPFLREIIDYLRTFPELAY